MWDSQWRALRDVLMFGIGAWGFHHEIVTVHAERPILIAAALALMGLPLFIGKGEK